MRALAELPSDQVEVVHKGFDTNFGSSPALLHLQTSSFSPVSRDEQINTGGYADGPRKKVRCHGNRDATVCFPSVAVMCRHGQITTQTLEHCGSCVETHGDDMCPRVHSGELSIPGFVVALPFDYRTCAGAIALSCNSETQGRDCRQCALEFSQNFGCPALSTKKDLALCVKSGSLCYVLEIGLACVPAPDGGPPVELPPGTDCDECVANLRSSACEEALESAGVCHMAFCLSAGCLPCARGILESCATLALKEHENFVYDAFDPGNDEYGNCIRSFEHHGGCEQMLAGKSPMHWLDSMCPGYVEEPKPMRAVPGILQARNIKKLIVIGLVFDFCVSETTIFAMEGLRVWALAFEPEEASVKGFSDHTRPSSDREPVAPFTEDVCDNINFNPYMPSGCRSDGATEMLYRRFKLDFEANSVDLTRLASIQFTVEAPEHVDRGRHRRLRAQRPPVAARSAAQHHRPGRAGRVLAHRRGTRYA